MHRPEKESLTARQRPEEGLTYVAVLLKCIAIAMIVVIRDLKDGDGTV